jgi:hypothetical protein
MKRQADIITYYSIEGDLVYQNNIQESMEELQLEHTSGQWRLFIDSCKVTLKAVLLHNGNKFRSAPLANAVHVKEMYENLQVLLQKVCYEGHWWNE